MGIFSSIKPLKAILLVLVLGIAIGCTEKSLYNIDEDERKSKLPSEEAYFGFETSGKVTLDVNYAVSGFVANIEVYSENPIGDNNAKKEGIKPIYSAFVKDGKLKAEMNIPLAVKKAYLYTERMGLPRCVELTADASGFTYDATKATVATNRSATRAVAGVLNDKAPYSLAPDGREDNMYSLCTWDSNGKPTSPGYLSTTTSDVNGLTARIQSYLGNNRVANGGKNENLRRETKDLNITIPAGGAKAAVTFIDENGAYQNVFGYYYYKSNAAPTSLQDFYKMPKYVIFPNASNASFILKCGDTAKLLFFGEDGKSEGVEEFPEGYVIGWFLLANGAPYASSNGMNIVKVNDFYTSGNAFARNICFSNETGNNRQFINLYDATSKLSVIGVEDEFGKSTGDNDFDDVMFCVKTTPEIEPGDRPIIPDETPEVEPATETIEGTLAFEDNWPLKGDYDMNDVIIEYKRVLTYDKDNYITKIEENFTPVQRDSAAVYNNLFAYQVKYTGTVSSLPAGLEYENASKSFVLTQGVKDIRNRTFTITRTFDSKINKDVIKDDFNPYIIVKGNRGQGRAEVHLPKYEPTDLIDRAKLYTESDAYYVYVDGKYPFAINLPILGFRAPKERAAIDSYGQYPAFRTWVDSKGEQAKDWYLK